MSDNNAQLIAEAKNYEGHNGTARWPALIRDLATALESATPRIVRTVEVEYRRIQPDGKRHWGTFDSPPEIDPGWSIECRTHTEWQPFTPTESGEPQ